MAKSKRELSLLIIGSAKGAVDALRLTDSSAQKMGKSVAKVSAALGVGFAAIGAAGAYMGKQVFDGAMKAVMGAAEDQKSVALLEKQIRSATNATDEQIRKNEEFITSLQYSAAVADSELRPALANLVRGTGNLTDAQSLLKLSLDISAATGRDLASVTMAMGRAATGNISALTRLGIPLDENTKKTKNFSALVGELNRQFGGASAEAVDTFDGRMRQLRIGIDEAVESLGYALLPYAERLVKFVNAHIVPAIQLFADNVGTKGLGGSFTLAVASMGEFGQKGIDAVEGVTLAVLVATRKIVDMAEKVLFIATVMNMLTGNAAAFAKTWTAGFSADRVKAGIDDALKDLPSMFDSFRGGVNKASDALARQAEEAEELRRRGIGVKEITKDVTDLMGSYGGAVGGASKQIDKANQKITAYTKGLEASTSAKKNAVSASKAVASAENDVAKSLANLERVRRRFQKITQGYGLDSKEATDAETARAKAQREAERSGYDYEQAVFAVAEAEKNLAQVRADESSTPQQIREAEIQLAEAKLSVADATDTQKEAALSLAEAERLLDIAINGAKEGTVEYQDALDDLRSAEEDHVAVVERLTEARNREAEAIQKVKEAEEELAALRKNLPKGTQINPETGEIVTPPAPAFPNFMSAVRAMHPNAPALDSKTPVRAARIAFPKLYEEYKKAGKALAQGGIVNGPTQVLIGEKGPEAVIPLDRLGSIGGMTVNVTVNAGIGVDPAQVGDEIVNVLQRYNRRNGALPLKVM